MLNHYKYDQLNRFLQARSYESGLSNNLWNPTSYNNEYFNKFEYDANGNILSQKRHLRNGTQTDDLTYHYLLENGKLVRNRLYHVNDAIAGATYVGDLEDQGIIINTSQEDFETLNNYKYDAEGRLIQDLAEGIQEIVWRVDGKVKKVIFEDIGAGSKNNLEFDYDAFGRRIAKHVRDQQGLLVKSTYYVLDAQGNQLLTYEHIPEDTTSLYQLAERVIYGSSRLGINVNKIDMLDENPEEILSLTLGNKLYEMSNHLGNVLTVINDIKVPQSSNSVDVDGYLATIVSTADYSPFGVQLDGRTESAESYRYGFNGMEKDDELKGAGNSYDFGARIYDSRLGRWLKRDPLERNYPFVSTYAFVNNNPVCYVDPDGKQIVIHYDSGLKDSKGNAIIESCVYTPGVKPAVSNQFVQQVHEAITYVMQNDDEKVFQTISSDLSIVNIVQTNDLDGNMCSDFVVKGNAQGNLDESNTHCTVYWNPNAMMAVCNDEEEEIGGGTAPSTILLHECDHARGFVGLKTKNDFDNFFADYNAKKDPMAGAYDNQEEKRVISGAESKYIKNVNKSAQTSSVVDCSSRRRSISFTGKIRDLVNVVTTNPQQQTARTNHCGKVYENTGGVNSIQRADGAYVQGQSTTTSTESETPAPCAPPKN